VSEWVSEWTQRKCISHLISSLTHAISVLCCLCTCVGCVFVCVRNNAKNVRESITKSLQNSIIYNQFFMDSKQVHMHLPSPLPVQTTIFTIFNRERERERRMHRLPVSTIDPWVLNFNRCRKRLLSLLCCLSLTEFALIFLSLLYVSWCYQSRQEHESELELCTARLKKELENVIQTHTQTLHEFNQLKARIDELL
jgi:hypothetical protein